MSDIALLGRDNKEGSLLRTNQTWECFEESILLPIGSFNVLTQMVFKHFKLELSNGYNVKEKYDKFWGEIFK